MNLNSERKLRKRGYKCVAGLDEAGRGPLAGPVFAAVVIVENCKSGIKNLKEVNDSKKLSPKKREELYKLLIEDKNIKWGIGRVSEKIIDKINILEATKKAMIRSIKNLEKRNKKIKVDYLIIDGNFSIKTNIHQKSVIKGDSKIFSCAAASIIAKVKRDRVMVKYHKKYPEYGFDKHKGYPTKQHRLSIKKYGSCKIHRATFQLLV
ncbi:MAG: ribonuclease HII [Patescibacteria group bacterium]|nr:ribonuclease HII [Patescibacteria group bacterium]MBU1876886.1 ribonuclease HII [Patescibacteria group bacterium]